MLAQNRKVLALISRAIDTARGLPRGVPFANRRPPTSRLLGKRAAESKAKKHVLARSLGHLRLPLCPEHKIVNVSNCELWGVSKLVSLAARELYC